MNPVRHACSLRGTRCQTKARRFIRKNMKGRLTHLCQTHQDERVAYVRVPRNWPAFTACHPLYPYTDEFGSTDQVIGHSIDSGLRFSFCKLLILTIEREGFIFGCKPLLVKQIENHTRKIHPKIPPSKIGSGFVLHWVLLAYSVSRGRLSANVDSS